MKFAPDSALEDVVAMVAVLEVGHQNVPANSMKIQSVPKQTDGVVSKKCAPFQLG